MPKIPRSTILISIALMVAAIAVACDSAAEKPTAEPEPPTAVPTVESQAVGTDDSVATGATRGDRQGIGFDDPVALECLSTELGLDVTTESGAFDLGVLRTIDPEDVDPALEACGMDQIRRPTGGAGGFGGGGLFAGGSPFSDPEIVECLTEELGEGALDNLGGGSGLGLEPESLAAFEECGLNFGGIDGGRGGFRGFGGDSGALSGGFTGDGSFQECLTEALGPDALLQLRNSGGAPSAELQDALSECGNAIAIPFEPGGGIGDGAGPIPLEEPTATPIPVSDLTIEQLTCLSGELDSAALANAVIATSSGDLSEIPDEILAALQTCGVGT